jgi:hypothetical protein
MRGPEGVPVGQLRRVNISNVVISNSDPRQCGIVTGIPGHYIEDVKFSNIYMQHRGGGTKENAAAQPSEQEREYPEPGRFGQMPAQGFFIRHVRGIDMQDIEIKPMTEDRRPAFVLEDVEEADFNHIELPRNAEENWRLKNVKGFGVSRSRPVQDVYLESAAQKSL